MRPNTVNQIHIDGRDRNAAQHLADLERKAMELHIRDYECAEQPVPNDVREQAAQMGIEVKG